MNVSPKWKCGAFVILKWSEFTAKSCRSMIFLPIIIALKLYWQNIPDTCIEIPLVRSSWRNCQDSLTLNEKLFIKLMNYSQFIFPFQRLVHSDSRYRCSQAHNSHLTGVKKVTVKGKDHDRNERHLAGFGIMNHVSSYISFFFSIKQQECALCLFKQELKRSEKSPWGLMAVFLLLMFD